VGDVGEASARPGLPPGLQVRERAPSTGWDDYHGPVVVFAHGSLDRGASFGRTALRLPDLALVTYDRRGYRASRDLGAAPLPAHVEDLVRIAEVYARAVPGASGGRLPQVVAVGHSVGATLVLWAGVVAPERFSALAAYEPSMPWLGFHPPTAPVRTAAPDGAGGPSGAPAGAGAATDPAAEAERFFRRMVGDAAWERLGDHERRSRQADGPALLADLRGIRMPTPFDVTALTVPTVVAAGGSASRPHHRKTVAWLAEHVAAVETMEVGEAGHGAHLSHPDAFAALVRRAVALGAARHAG
jgi:pimeloyl-ACP methyl ester carboxylesterase